MDNLAENTQPFNPGAPAFGAQVMQARQAEQAARLARAQHEPTFQPVSEATIKRAAIELAHSVDAKERAIGETILDAQQGNTPADVEIFTRMLADRWPYAHTEDLLNAALPGSLDNWEQWVAALATKQAEARALSPQPANNVDPSGLRQGPAGPWILQRDGFYWLNQGGGTYGAHVKTADLLTKLARDLSTRIPLNESSGKPLPVPEILKQYGVVIDGARKRYIERRSYYDAKNNELICAALRWRDESEARFNPAIDRWLRALVGETSYPKLAAWIAALVELDRPAPLLYIEGGAGIGKTLLTAGLAQLWHCPPVDFAEAIESFNEASARSPFFVGDDGFPQDLDFQRLRKMITQDTRRVNEKYTPKYDVDGFARFLVSANNDDQMRYQKTGTLTKDDVEAISDRLLVLRTVLKKSEAEELHFKGNDLKQWASEGIARHALWLNKQAQEQGWFSPAHVRMVCQPGGGERLLLRLACSRVPELLPFLVRYLEDPRRIEYAGFDWCVRTRWHSVLVQVTKLQERLGLKYKDRDIVEICKLLSVLDDKGEAQRKRVRPPGQTKNDGAGDWYRVLDPERIFEAWPDGYDDRAVKTLLKTSEERLGIQDPHAGEAEPARAAADD